MKTLVLDPGHGGIESGAVSFGTNEKDINLSITLKVGKNLTEKYEGVKIIYTRKTDKTVGLTQRSTIANNAKADYFFSFHYNAWRGDARGYRDYRYLKASAETKRIQKIICADMGAHSKAYGSANGGSHARDFSVLRKTVMPALLFETLFLDNKEDYALIMNDSFIDKTAEVYAAAIAKAAGLKAKPQPKPELPKSPPQLKTVYELYVDGLPTVEAAIKALEAMKGLGYVGTIGKKEVLK